MKTIALLAALLCCAMPALADDTDLVLSIALGAAMDHFGVTTMIKNELDKPKVERHVAEYKFQQVVPPLYAQIHKAKLDNSLRDPLIAKIDDIGRQSKCVPVGGQWKWNCNASDTATLNRARELGEKLRGELGPVFAKQNAIERRRAEVSALMMQLSDHLEKAPLLKSDKPGLVDYFDHSVKVAPCVRQTLDCSNASPEGLEAAWTELGVFGGKLDAAVHRGLETRIKIKEMLDLIENLRSQVGKRRDRIGNAAWIRLMNEIETAYAKAGFVFGPGGANYENATPESIAAARPLLEPIRQELGQEVHQSVDPKDFVAQAEELQGRIPRAGLAPDTQGRLRQRLEELLGHARCMGGQHIDCAKATAEGLKTAQEALAALRKDLEDESHKAYDMRSAAKPFAESAGQFRASIRRAPISSNARASLEDRVNNALNGVPCSYGDGITPDCSKATPAGLKAAQEVLAAVRKDLDDEMKKAGDTRRAAQSFAVDAAGLKANIVRSPVAPDERKSLEDRLEKSLDGVPCSSGQTLDCSKATPAGLKAAQDVLVALRKDFDDELRKANAARQLGKQFATEAAGFPNYVRGGLKTAGTQDALIEKYKLVLKDAGCTEPGAEPDCSYTTADKVAAGRKALAQLRDELGQAVKAERAQQQQQ